MTRKRRAGGNQRIQNAPVSHPSPEIESVVGRFPAPASERRPRQKVRRNDPCPCESGRKYKHCHLEADESNRAVFARAAALHDLDRDLVMRILRFAGQRFPDLDSILRIDTSTTGGVKLVSTWSVFTCSVEGVPLSEWFRSGQASRLSPVEHDWLDAEQRAWLSVWEVTGVRPGEGIDLRDLLTGETRSVVERGASGTLMLRHAILARVVDYKGLSMLCGTHSQALQPAGAHEIVQRIRKRLRRKKLVPVDRLRPEKLQRFLMACWDNAALFRYKRKHYEAWLDESIPALDGKTPRQAAATRLGRQRVDLLLKEMENHEARVPEAERFDFDRLRRALNIEM